MKFSSGLKVFMLFVLIQGWGLSNVNAKSNDEADRLFSEAKNFHGQAYRAKALKEKLRLFRVVRSLYHSILTKYPDTRYASVILDKRPSFNSLLFTNERIEWLTYKLKRQVFETDPGTAKCLESLSYDCLIFLLEKKMQGLGKQRQVKQLRESLPVFYGIKNLSQGNDELLVRKIRQHRIFPDYLVFLANNGLEKQVVRLMMKASPELTRYKALKRLDQWEKYDKTSWGKRYDILFNTMFDSLTDDNDKKMIEELRKNKIVRIKYISGLFDEGKTKVAEKYVQKIYPELTASQVSQKVTDIATFNENQLRLGRRFEGKDMSHDPLARNKAFELKFCADLKGKTMTGGANIKKRLKDRMLAVSFALCSGKDVLQPVSDYLLLLRSDISRQHISAKKFYKTVPTPQRLVEILMSFGQQETAFRAMYQMPLIQFEDSYPKGLGAAYFSTLWFNVTLKLFCARVSAP